MKTLSALLAIGFAFSGYAYLQRPISYPAGVLVESEPAQIARAEGEAPIEHGEYRLKPLARFSLDGRVLHRKVYRYDRESKLVPIDLAVGWGPMSDQAVLDQIKITQSMRFYHRSLRHRSSRFMVKPWRQKKRHLGQVVSGVSKRRSGPLPA